MYCSIYTAPEQTARYYYEAVINGDETGLIGLTCSSQRDRVQAQIKADGGLANTVEGYFGPHPVATAYVATDTVAHRLGYLARLCADHRRGAGAGDDDQQRS